MTAGQIAKLLLAKHDDTSKYLCVPECKTGPTHTGPRFRQFDLWVMNKSWSREIYWGYEIKVNRQDFLRDEKWMAYLPYCTDFYFVVPHGLVDVSEVPEQAGLLVTSKNGTRLFTKKKAPRRVIETPLSIFAYILMWRAEVQAEWKSNGNLDKSYWVKWLAQKDEKKEIGWNVSRKISQLVKERIDKQATENKLLRHKVEKLEAVEKALKEIGISANHLSSWNVKDQLERKLEEIKRGVPRDLTHSLRDAENAIHRARKILERELTA